MRLCRCGRPGPGRAGQIGLSVRAVDGLFTGVDGISFAYTFQDADATERHTVQHFEMAGSRAIEEKAPYAFTGTVKQVVFDLQPVNQESEQDLHRHQAHQAIAGGIAG